LEDVKAQVASGALGMVRRVIEVTPTKQEERGPVFGVAECWNAMAEEAFNVRKVAWAFIVNDDVGFTQGSLGQTVEEVWRGHASHSLLLANEGLPGVGYAFSAFVLTRTGYLALGKFDENFFPAYYEVSLARLQLNPHLSSTTPPSPPFHSFLKHHQYIAGL